MQAELIHPYDLAELLYKRLDVVAVTEHDGPSDELIEIDGKLYLQSVRIPAKTTDIR